jgi:hypothetical protein
MSDNRCAYCPHHRSDHIKTGRRGCMGDAETFCPCDGFMPNNSPNIEEILFIKFCNIVKARSPEAWQLIRVGTVKELVRVAVERLRTPTVAARSDAKESE